MKVISGIYKGRNLKGFNMPGTRPTMDRVKESLFACIQNDLKESVVLDLFSGSASLAIEALSQGAKEAYAVDKNKEAIKTINENIKNIGVKNCKVYLSSYDQALQKFKAENQLKVRRENNAHIIKNLTEHKESLNIEYDKKYSFRNITDRVINNSKTLKEDEFLEIANETIICARFTNCKFYNIKFKIINKKER